MVAKSLSRRKSSWTATLKVVSSDKPKTVRAKAPVRSTIAAAARSTVKPDTPLEVRSKDVPGLLLRIQPSGHRSYYLQVSRGNRRLLGDARVLTLGMAEANARAILLDPEGTAAKAKKAEGTTLRQFLDDEYEPWCKARKKSATATLQRIRGAWGSLLDEPMHRITADVLDRIRTQRMAKGRAKRTINRDAAALGGLFTLWCAQNKGAVHAVRALDRIKEPHDMRVRFLSEAEEARLRKVLAERDAKGKKAGHPDGFGPYCDHLTPLVLIALGTGMRKGELLALEWQRVDLERNEVTVTAETSKGDATRKIPLTKEAASVFLSIKPAHDCRGLIFKSHRKEEGEPCSHFNSSWLAVIEEAEVQDFRYHDLRHTYASRLVQRGASLYKVQQLLGHATSAMTQRYAHLSPEHLADVVALLD